jgi:plastocyanin
VRRNTFQRMPRPEIEAPPPVEEPVPAIAVAPASATDQPVEAIPVPVPVHTVHHVVSSEADVPAPAVPRESGRISGKVVLLGEPPAERKITPDPTCGRLWAKLNIPAFTRFYVTGKDHALADVVVSLRLDDPLGARRGPRRSHILKTKACLYQPYISAIQAGQTVVVENDDSVLHNIHLMSVLNGEYNRAQFRGHSVKFTLREPEEFVTFKCDVHPWEFAYVSVFDHPFFAVSDKNGVFVIPAVPPGKYILEARHRKAGTLVKEITLEPHRNVDVRFEFEMRRLKPPRPT